MVVVAGIDVSKATLDVSVSEGDVCRFNNTGKGISSLLKHIERQGVTKAVCESTGGYERLVVGKLREGGDQRAGGASGQGARICPRVWLQGQDRPLDAQVLSRTAWCSLSLIECNQRWTLTVRSCGSC